MITPLHSRAIGQILALNDAPLGTGFLIAVDGGRGKVLTAGHVVDGHERVKIRFDKVDGTRTQKEKTSSNDVKIVRGTHDWALLDIEAPEGVTPLVLYPPPFTTTTVRWRTIGYPRSVAYTRASLHGDVRVADADELDLHCVELPAGAPAEAAKGLSGAPCLIDGGVAGIVRDGLGIGRTNPTNPTAALFVLPSQIIAREAGLSYVDGTKLSDRLPYELYFTGKVESWNNADLQIAAEVAKLDPRVTYPPNVIARRMINEGIETTGLVLQRLDRPAIESEPLIELASTLWVHGEAAMHMEGVIAQDRPALLTTDSESSAEHHLSRAFACRNHGRPTWPYVHIGGIHGDIDQVVADVEAGLVERLHADSSTAVDRIVRSRGPVTVFLHGSPREELTEALKRKWADLRIVYLADVVVPSAGPQGLEVISPKPDRAQEDQAREASRWWRGELRLSPGGGAR